MGIRIENCDLGLELGLGIGVWDLGLEIGIWNLGLGLGMGDRGLVLGIGIGIGIRDYSLIWVSCCHYRLWSYG